MLFMDIWTWEPDKRDEIERWASEWKFPEGIKEHGYWLDITGRYAFCLYEVEDPKALLGANHYWTDIAKVKSFPVMDMKNVMELMQEKIMPILLALFFPELLTTIYLESGLSCFNIYLG